MRPIALEFEKWKQWAQQIQDDITMRLVHRRQVFREFAQIVVANSKHIEENCGDLFCEFVRDCYVSHLAMAIRRHVKRDKDSVSLMRLLEEILECANQFTYRFYLQQFPIDPDYVNWQEGTFSQFSDDGKVVSREMVQRDIDNLKGLTSQVEQLADKAIAHLDKRGFEGSVTFGNLDACVDAFDKLVCKYLKLITAAGYITTEPAILLDWKRIFTVPFDVRRQSSE